MYEVMQYAIGEDGKYSKLVGRYDTSLAEFKSKEQKASTHDLAINPPRVKCKYWFCLLGEGLLSENGMILSEGFASNLSWMQIH